MDRNITWRTKKYDLQTQSTQVFLRNVLHNNSIREIIPYNDSLIIATHNGISIFDTHTNKSTILSSEQIDLQRMSVTTILLDSQNNYGLLFRINYFATTCSINHGSIFVFANRRTV